MRSMLLLLSLFVPVACSVSSATKYSGIPVSAVVPAFRPAHVSGPFAGRDVCPVCTNGNAPQVQVWVTQQNLTAGLELARVLQAQAPVDAAASLPVYLVVVGGDAAAIRARIAQTPGKQTPAIQSPEQSTREVPVLHMNTIEGTDAALYQIHDEPTIATTVHWITCRRVFARDVNLEPTRTQARSDAVWPQLATFAAPDEVTQSYIAPPWEPGERLVIQGRVLDAQGQPIAGRKLTAWQTDARGLYNEPGNGRQEPTLSGLLWTADDGAYRWETIKPAPYPTQTQPGHIHMGLEREGQDQFWRTLWFEGDDLLDDSLDDGQRAWAADNAETVIIELHLVDGVWQGTHDIRVS